MKTVLLDGGNDMGLKRMFEHEGSAFSESDRLRLVNGIAKINCMKSLEQLSDELSAKYGKNVTVVDVLEENQTNYSTRSLILGEEFTDLLEGYKFNHEGFNRIVIDTKKILNISKTQYDVYVTSLVYKEG